MSSCMARPARWTRGCFGRCCSGSRAGTTRQRSRRCLELIGLSKSTVSREFKKATAAKLKEFQERDLSGYDVVALVLDGKSFAEDEMVVALGVTTKGDKVFLGFVQTDTENAVVIRSFLRSLKE